MFKKSIMLVVGNLPASINALLRLKIREIAEYLAENNFVPIILGPYNGKNLKILKFMKKKTRTEIRLFYILIPSLITFRFMGRTIPIINPSKLLKIAKRLSTDIIHVHGHFPSCVIAVLIFALLRKKVIITFHGVLGEFNHIGNFLQRVYLRIVCKIFSKFARKIVVLTYENARQLAKFGCQTSKFIRIPNSVNIEHFKPANKQLRNVIMWHGRFVKEKGVMDIIEAAKIVIKKRPDVKFVLIGRGPLKKEITKIIQSQNFKKNIFLPGFISREKIPLILSKASIYIFPSYMEGMPYALLEAMACGLPIVAYDIPQIRETTRGASILVRKGDVQRLADAIFYLLENEEERRRLGKNARKIAEEYYNDKVVTKKLIYLYERCLMEK